MAHGSVLIVDEKRDLRDAVAAVLERQGIASAGAATAEAALRAARASHHDVILVDPDLPRLGGGELLRALRHADPHALILVLAGYATVRDAVDAMRVGVFDYLAKPLRSEELILAVKRAFERVGERAAPAPAGKEEFAGMLGSSAAMRRVFEAVRRVADAPRATVLIEGESGTGKEVVARAIHRESRRRAFPFVSVHCAAIPTELLESELFGHEKGAFTGAIRMQKGKFELADRGTLLLDEVGTLEARAQIDLLRVLQERAFTRIGGSELIRTDARVIATTNEPLAGLVREGRFREDLFYRLNVVRIGLPPLRERAEDIPPLVQHCLRRYARENDRPVAALTRSALQALCRHPWPGNVRQLENVIERAVVMSARAEIDLEQIAEEPPAATGAGPSDKDVCLERRVGALERELIVAALARVGGSRVRAAERLGITERTLRYKIHKHGIEVPGRRSAGGRR